MTPLPPKVVKQIQNAICRPEGTFDLAYSSSSLQDPDVRGGVVLEIPSGQHLFRLERDDELQLHFFHSSPGTGTRKATVDLGQVSESTKFRFIFTWSPQEIWLYVGPEPSEGELVKARGKKSDKQFRVGQDGGVYQVGDDGIQVQGVRIYTAGKQVLVPTAKETWDETTNAVEILQNSYPDDVEFRVRTVATNLTMLVTGFEAYCKTRFLELEQEGISPDSEAIIRRFYPKHERDMGIQAALEAEANENRVSLLRKVVVRGAINFQNYDDCKRAFNKAYDIKFGELGCTSGALEAVQRFIRYRHRIVHVSPMLGMLNQESVPPDEPVFPSKETAEQGIDSFNALIDALHAATLECRP